MNHKRGMNKLVVGAAAIVVYWLVYWWQDTLSNLGDYRFFPYGFHEVYPIGTMLVPLLSAIWFVKVLIGTVREKTWRRNAVVLAVLTLLLLGQAGLLHYQSQRITVITLAEVIDIPDEYHIVIQNEAQTITLETTPLVPRLLKTDGTLYWFDYGTNRLHPERGALYCVSD